MYGAITSRDERFDGVFYTAVRTTGVYCKPSCPARKPHRNNVTFYPFAAAAQSAGYRACRRCVPEALPGSPLWNVRGSVAGRALELIERGVLDDEGVSGLARRLGYSTRSVTRTVVQETGATPIAHARARRARVAKELLGASDQPISDIAFAAGFSSIRQFNATMSAIYGRSPSQLRRTSAARASGVVRATLAYRAPFDFGALLDWYTTRALPGVEEARDGTYRVALAMPFGTAILTLRDDPERSQILADLDLADLRDYGATCAVARRLLDLDADPVGIDAHLTSSSALGDVVSKHPGMRLPGTLTPTEALLRALTGQQVSVASGLAQMQRMVDSAGDGSEDDTDLVPFPSASAIAAAGLEWFRGPDARRRTIGDVLDLAVRERLDSADDPAQVAELLRTVKGVGPWTVAYTLLRGFGAPDVDLSGDRAIVNAVAALGNGNRGDAAKVLASASPWRSYAAMHLWRSGT